VDSLGLPHAIAIIRVNETDRNGAISMIKANKKQLKEVKKVLADGDYRGLHK